MTHCECGCGWEGIDDVTQFCVEEAAAFASALIDEEDRKLAESQERGESPATRLVRESFEKYGGNRAAR